MEPAVTREVYVVEYGHWDAAEIVGVYSTRERAAAVANTAPRGHATISAFVLDAPPVTKES